MDEAVDKRRTATLAGRAREESASDLALVMDQLSHGVLIASARGQLLHANRAAQGELAKREVIAVYEGHLHTTDQLQSRVLTQALAKAETGKRSLIALRAGATRVSIAVVPLRPERAKQSPPVALVLSRASVCDALMLCFFARNYGLTHTEEQVLGILCQGYSAPEVALQMNVAVSTVRSHVRSMCTKTHSNGVRALVGQVAVLPPLGAARLQEPMH